VSTATGADSSAFLHDDENDYLVIIPTVGVPEVVVPCVDRLFRVSAGLRVKVVVVVNPDPGNPRSAEAVERLEKLTPPDGASLIVETFDAPLGFARAVNEGFRVACEVGVPETTVVLNDDALVTMGWLQGLRTAMKTQFVRFWGDIPDEQGQRIARPVSGYGTVGIVGPMSNNVAGSQKVSGAVPKSDSQLDAFAYSFRANRMGGVLTTSFVSGFCMAFSRDCVEAVGWHIPVPGESRLSTTFRPTLFDEVFGVGGYEDNDICARAERAGFRCAIAEDVYVHHLGHQTLDRAFPEAQRGLANVLTYYEKWADEVRGDKLVAVFRVKLSTGNDLHLWRAAFLKAATVVDGICVLLTGNPLEMQQSPDWEMSMRTFPPHDMEMLKKCSNSTPEECATAVRNWIALQARGLWHDGPDNALGVKVGVWEGEFNERDERNASVIMAEQMGADWIISIDHDEVIEDRITRRHFDRLMNHPDPLVDSWDFSWLTHWDGKRLIRTDPPWADGRRYRFSMRGFRMWRVNKIAPRRIALGNEKGLHCGNCPDYSIAAKRVSGVRFRHFGYARQIDRARKTAWYRAIDPSGSESLTGSSNYGHHEHEEGMSLSPYRSDNGIGLTMLVYEKEHLSDLARHLDLMYGLVDRIVLVWTGEEMFDEESEWARLGDLFGAEWIHQPLNLDYATARNAGVKRLREFNNEGLSWAITFDPDEQFSEPFGDMVAIRRMAERTDSWGWLFEFANHRVDSDGQLVATPSWTPRMFWLDPWNIMEYNGRVHEGFDDSLAQVHDRGEHPQLGWAPFRMHNRGTAGDDDKTEDKLERYTTLLLKELEDRPDRSGPWVSLGVQLLNDGDETGGLQCLNNACRLAVHENSYLAFKELAVFHLHMAMGLMAEAQSRTARSHPEHQSLGTILGLLEEHAPKRILSGSARTGSPVQRVKEIPQLTDEHIESARARRRRGKMPS